jgi:hypothetical protein
MPDRASRSTGHPVELHAHYPTRARPGLGAQHRTNAAGQHELSRRAVGVDGPLDRTEDLGHLLPLVEQHRPGSAAKGGVRVRPVGGGPPRLVQLDDLGSKTSGGGGLARSPRAGEQHGRQLAE